jgi:ketosteroid isomerase-like protein
MSKDNVEVVRRAVDAFNRRDLDGLMCDVDPDVEVDWSRSTGVEAGTYRGVAAARRFWGTFFDGFEQIVAVPEEYIEHLDYVIVPNTAHVRGRQGIEVEARSAAVVELRDGHIVLWRLFRAKAEALEAVGAGGGGAHGRR